MIKRSLSFGKELNLTVPDASDPVDLVYLWVNGSDPHWLRLHDQYKGLLLEKWSGKRYTTW